MKHKTEHRQNTLESSSQTSSGVTAWLSMADRSSPVPGGSICRITNYTGRLCRDPGEGGRGSVLGDQQDWGHVDYSPTEPPENGSTLPRCAQTPCTGIIYHPFFVYSIHYIPFLLQIQAWIQAQFRETNWVNSIQFPLLMFWFLSCKFCANFKHWVRVINIFKQFLIFFPPLILFLCWGGWAATHFQGCNTSMHLRVQCTLPSL